MSLLLLRMFSCEPTLMSLYDIWFCFNAWCCYHHFI